jgi:DNA-binding Lrp family transcriptional regulator
MKPFLQQTDAIDSRILQADAPLPLEEIGTRVHLSRKPSGGASARWRRRG